MAYIECSLLPLVFVFCTLCVHVCNCCVRFLLLAASCCTWAHVLYHVPLFSAAEYFTINIILCFGVFVFVTRSFSLFFAYFFLFWFCVEPFRGTYTTLEAEFLRSIRFCFMNTISTATTNYSCSSKKCKFRRKKGQQFVMARAFVRGNSIFF